MFHNFQDELLGSKDMLIPGVPAGALTGVNMKTLFDPDKISYWPDGYDPSKKRLYQESTGITQVMAANQPVGLSLDYSLWGGKSFDGLIASQPELVTGFLDGWTALGSATIIDDDTFQTNGSNGVWKSILTVGKSYRLTITSDLSITVVNAAAASPVITSVSAGVPTTVIFIATGDVVYLRRTSTGTINISDFSIKEIPGTLALQATALSRPTTYKWPKATERRNLLTNTAFVGGVSGNPGTAPTGWAFGSTGGTLEFNDSGELVITTVNSRHFIQPSPTISCEAGVTYCYSVIITANPDNLAIVDVMLFVGQPSGFTGTIYLNGVAGLGSRIPQPGDVIARTVSHATEDYILQARIGMGVSANRTGTIGFTQPQFEIGEHRSNYQKVGLSSADIEETGIPPVWHLYNDGGDSLNIDVPEGTYASACVDYLGDIVYEELENPETTLLTERQADVIIREDPFTPAEMELINTYWKRKYGGSVWQPYKLFSGGQEGYWAGGYDPAQKTIYQTNVGNLLSSAGTSVGLGLSIASWNGKSFDQVMAEQPECVDQPLNFLVAPYATSSATLGTNTITSIGGGAGLLWSGLLGETSAREIIVEYSGLTSGNFAICDINSARILTSSTEPSGTLVARYVPVNEANLGRVYLRLSLGNQTVTVTKFSVKEIPDYTASQATALSRPTLARYPKGGELRNLWPSTIPLSNRSLYTSDVSERGIPLGLFMGNGSTNTGNWNSGSNLFAETDVVVGSIYAKRGTNPRIMFALTGGGTSLQSNAVFNFDTEEFDFIGTNVDAWSVNLGGGIWRLAIRNKANITTAGLRGLRVRASNPDSTTDQAYVPVNGETYIWGAPQLEIGTDFTPYQQNVSVNEVIELNTPNFYHLYNDGGDSLPVTLPEDTYGIAYIDHLSDIYYATRSNPSDTLFAERQIDVILRKGAFTDYEKTKIQQYWKSKYAGKPAPDIMELDFITGRAKVVDYANPQNLFFGDINDLLTYSSPSPKYVLNSSGVLEVGTTLRCDHDADGNPLGILIEGQRTNQFVYSNRYVFPTWLTHRCTVDNDIVIAPDGLTTAADITQAADQGIGPLISQDSTIITEGSTYTVSAFFKSSDYKYAIFGDYQISDTGVSYSYINLETGDVTLNANHTSGGMIYVGGGWYRAWITCTAVQSNPTDGQTAIGMGDKADTTISAENRGGKFSIWGAQFEQGDFPTSYIKTEAVQVTRAADVISLATSAFPYNADEGTLILSASVQDASPQSYLAELRASTNQRVYMRTSGGTARLVVISATEQASVVGGSVVSDQPFTIAGAYKVDDCAVSLSGAAIVKDTQASMPAAASSLFFGSSNGTANFLDGHIKRGIYIPRRLSDAELIARSTL